MSTFQGCKYSLLFLNFIYKKAPGLDMRNLWELWDAVASCCGAAVQCCSSMAPGVGVAAGSACLTCVLNLPCLTYSKPDRNKKINKKDKVYERK